MCGKLAVNKNLETRANPGHEHEDKSLCVFLSFNLHTLNSYTYMVCRSYMKESRIVEQLVLSKQG